MRGIRDRLFRSTVRQGQPADVRKMHKQVGEILARIRVRNIAPIELPAAPAPYGPVDATSHPRGRGFSARA